MDNQEKVRLIPIVGNIEITESYSNGSPKKIVYTTSEYHKVTRLISYNSISSCNPIRYYKVSGDFVSFEHNAVVDFEAQYDNYNDAYKFFNKKLEQHPTSNVVIKEFTLINRNHYR